MKTVMITVLVFLSVKSYCQHNLYTFNNGSLIEETKLKLQFNASKKALPPTHELTAVIYNKVIKNDTVINYVNFSVSKKSTVRDSQDLKFIYRQDSTFLLLNQRLPAFKLKDMLGNEISSAKFLGKPILINFWATYCGPCIEEMPQLSRLKKKYEGKMNFIAITENNTDKDHLLEFLKNKDFNFQVLTEGKIYEKELKIKALPKSLFVDSFGILRYIQDGYPINTSGEPSVHDNNDFTKIIDKLIGNSNQQ
jgi:thiol-disulfide isomerase/thioredoxin